MENWPDLLTVVIAASPIPSHPQATVISETMESLAHLGLGKDVRIILVHDAVNPERIVVAPNEYDEYLERLCDATRSLSNVEVHLLQEWSHLAGVVRYAFDQVTTPMVLLLQHDLPFIRDVPLRDLVFLMMGDSPAKHVRFNAWPNIPVAWDGGLPNRRSFFSTIDTGASKIDLIQSACWTDQNHLTTKSYYDKIVMPLLRGRKTFMEVVMDPLSRPSTHSVLGTYVLGRIGEPPVIRHRDGARFQLGAREPRVSWQPVAEETSRLKMAVARLANSLNLRRPRLRDEIRLLLLRRGGDLGLRVCRPGPVPKGSRL